MNAGDAQQLPIDDVSAAAEWDKDAARRSLDELFSFARKYKTSKAYLEFIRFVARFRLYAPFNAMLVHIQKPGATFVAPPHRWLNEYQRRIKPEATPLLILQPMGPVMFVFDIGDTEPEPGAPPLPPEVDRPFEARRGHVKYELALTIENANRDGVNVTERAEGSQGAGEIHTTPPGKNLTVLVKSKPKPEYQTVPVRYELLVNSQHSKETKYATVVHELAHLYCGHLGTPDPRWWPDRRGLSQVVREFEAESVCYLVCRRLGIECPSDEYLAGYLRSKTEVPPISLECVVKAAGLIEQMGRGRMKPRKDHPQ